MYDHYNNQYHLSSMSQQPRNIKNKVRPSFFSEKFKSLDNINTFNRLNQDVSPGHTMTPTSTTLTRNILTMDMRAPRSLIGSPLPSLSVDNSFHLLRSPTNLQRQLSKGFGLNKSQKKAHDENIEDSSLKLVKVLGSTIHNNASVSLNPMSGVVAYPAGSAVIGYSTKISKRFILHNTVTCLITALSFSVDGKLLATGESGKCPSVRIWNVASGREIGELCGHKYRVGAVTFSGDSRYIVSVGCQEDMTINLWDLVTYQRTASSRVTSKVNAVMFWDSGRCFITVGVRHIRYWYLEDGRHNTKSTTVLSGRNAILGDIFMDKTFTDVGCCPRTLGPDSESLASGVYVLSRAGHLIEFTEQRTIKRWVELQTPRALCMSVTDLYIMIGCAKGAVFICDTESLHVLTSLPRPHVLGINVNTGHLDPSVTCAPDRYPDVIGCRYNVTQSRVTCFYQDHSFYIWDIDDNLTPRKITSHLYHSGSVTSIDPVHKSGSDSTNTHLHSSSFVTGSDDDTIRFWSVKDASKSRRNRQIKDILPENEGHNLSEDLLGTIYTDPYLMHLIDCDRHSVTGNHASTSNTVARHGIRCLKISPDHRHLATAHRDGYLKIYSMEDCTLLLHSIEAHNAEILSIDYFRSPSVPDLILFCSGSRDRVIRVMDPRQAYKCIQIIEDHSGAVLAAKIVETPSDQEIRLISCGMDKSILFRILQPEESGLIARFFVNRHLVGKYSHYDMVITPNQRYATVVCHDRTVRVYNLVTGKLLKSYRGMTAEDGTLLRCAIDPSGTYIATSGSDKYIHLLSLSTGDIICSIRSHSEVVLGICFLYDLKHVVSVSADHCVFVWRLPVTVTATMRRRILEAGSPHVVDCGSRRDSAAPSTGGTVTPSRLSDDANPGSSNTAISGTSLSRDLVDVTSPEIFRFSVSALPSWAQKKFNRRDSITFVQVNLMSEICSGMSTLMERTEETPLDEEGRLTVDYAHRRMSFISTEKIVRDDDSDNVDEDDDDEFLSVVRDTLGQCIEGGEGRQMLSTEDEDDGDDSPNKMSPITGGSDCHQSQGKKYSEYESHCNEKSRKDSGNDRPDPTVKPRLLTEQIKKEDHVLTHGNKVTGEASISSNHFSFDETSNLYPGSKFDTKVETQHHSRYQWSSSTRSPMDPRIRMSDLVGSDKTHGGRDQVIMDTRMDVNVCQDLSTVQMKSMSHVNITQLPTIDTDNTESGDASRAPRSHFPVLGRCTSVRDDKSSGSRWLGRDRLDKCLSTSTMVVSDNYGDSSTNRSILGCHPRILSRTMSHNFSRIGDTNTKDNGAIFVRQTSPVSADDVNDASRRHINLDGGMMTVPLVTVTNNGDALMKYRDSDKYGVIGIDVSLPGAQYQEPVTMPSHVMSDDSPKQMTMTNEDGGHRVICTDEYVDHLFRTHSNQFMSTMAPMILRHIIDHPNLDNTSQRQVRSKLLFEMETLCRQLKCNLEIDHVIPGTTVTVKSIKEIGDMIVEEVKRQLRESM